MQDSYEEAALSPKERNVLPNKTYKAMEVPAGEGATALQET